MARPPPAGAISARARPISLSGLWRSRQMKDQAFGYMRDLISVLHTVAPQVLEDPHFLERCLLLDGVPATVSRCDLIRSILGVQTAVLVRDSQTGFRIGLLVFFDASGSAAVSIQTPREGLYATCTPAAGHGDEVSRTYILDGIAAESARRSTARVLRSLLPTQYILSDADREFHLRCVLVGAGRATVSEGAYGLCDLAWKVLFARGYVVAAIVHRDRQAGVLVYDGTDSTELVTRRAPQLLHERGLQLHDSSLFPFVADPSDLDASLLRRLLPACVTDDEERYRGRVLLFTGLELDSQKLDAADLAHFLQFEVDVAHTVEAVIIHRSEGVVLAVLGSSGDAVSVLQTPKETWLRFFGQTPGCSSVFGFARAYCDYESADISSCTRQQWGARYRGSVLTGGFPERCLLLSGVVEGITSFDLSARLSPFGELYVVALDTSGLVLAIFRSWHGAARLLREPEETWAALGFLHCSRIPDAEQAGIVTQEVVDRFLMEEIVDAVLR